MAQPLPDFTKEAAELEDWTQAAAEPAAPIDLRAEAESRGKEALRSLPLGQVGRTLGRMAVEAAPGLVGGIVGSARGTALGAPLGPLGALAGGLVGGITGYATGETARQGGESLGQVAAGEIPPMEGLQQVAARVPGALVEGAKGEAIGLGVRGAIMAPVAGARLGRRLLQGSLAQPTESTLAAREAAERLGTTMPAASMSGSSWVEKVESLPQRTAAGEAGVAGFRAKVRGGLERPLRELGEEVGIPARGNLESMSTLPEEAGVAVRRDIGDLVTGRRTEALGDVDALIRTVGTPMRGGRIEQGRQVQENLREAGRGARQEASAAYDAAISQMGGADAPVRLSALNELSRGQAQVAGRIIIPGEPAASIARKVEAGTTQPIDFRALPDEAINELIRMGRVDIGAGRSLTTADIPKALIDKYGLDTVQSRSLGESVTLWQKLNQAAFKTAGTAEGRNLRALADAALKDIEAATGNVAPLQAATAQYAGEVGQVYGKRTPVGKAMYAVERSGKVADAILKAQDPDMVANIVRALRSKPDELRAVSATVLQRFREQAGDDPVKWASSVLKMGDDNITQLFGGRANDVRGTARRLMTDFSTPDPVEKAILGAGNGVSITNRVLSPVDTLGASRTWGKLTEDTQSAVRQALVYRILRAAGTGDQFDVAAVNAAINAVPERTRRMVLSGDQSRILEDINQVSRQISEHSSRFMQTPHGESPWSGSGWLGLPGAILGSLLTGHWSGAGAGVLAGIASPYMLGKAVTSPSIQRFMSGLPSKETFTGRIPQQAVSAAEKERARQRRSE